MANVNRTPDRHPSACIESAFSTVACWQVRDAHGNDYGAFPDHGEAADFGNVVASRLGLDEIRLCRVLVARSDLAGTLTKGA